MSPETKKAISQTLAAIESACILLNRLLEETGESGEGRTLLLTKEAAALCGFSPGGLIKAKDRGEVKPAGKRGRSLTWDRAELERFMRRGQPNDEVDATAPVHGGIERIKRDKPQRNGEASGDDATTTALRGIRAMIARREGRKR